MQAAVFWEAAASLGLASADSPASIEIRLHAQVSQMYHGV